MFCCKSRKKHKNINHQKYKPIYNNQYDNNQYNCIKYESEGIYSCPVHECNEYECPICLIECDKFIFYVCGHCVCTNCYYKWLKMSNRCPMCNTLQC